MQESALEALVPGLVWFWYKRISASLLGPCEIFRILLYHSFVSANRVFLGALISFSSSPFGRVGSLSSSCCRSISNSLFLLWEDANFLIGCSSSHFCLCVFPTDPHSSVKAKDCRFSWWKVGNRIINFAFLLFYFGFLHFFVFRGEDWFFPRFSVFMVGCVSGPFLYVWAIIKKVLLTSLGGKFLLSDLCIISAHFSSPLWKKRFPAVSGISSVSLVLCDMVRGFSFFSSWLEASFSFRVRGFRFLFSFSFCVCFLFRLFFLFRTSMLN